MGNKPKSVYSGAEGQAVFDGVMMRSGEHCAMFLQPREGKNVDCTYDEKGSRKGLLRRIPFLRGPVAFVESLYEGLGNLEHSLEVAGEEEEEVTQGSVALMGLKIFLSVVLAVLLLLVFPYVLSLWLKTTIQDEAWLGLAVDGGRTCLFLLFLLLVAVHPLMRRLFRYQGAVHQCLNCVEKGRVLNEKNAGNSSRFYKRSRAGFTLSCLLLWWLLCFFVTSDSLYYRMLNRFILLIVTESFYYEIWHIAAWHDGWPAAVFSAPALFSQIFFTARPEEAMRETAMEALKKVLDCRAFRLAHFKEEEELPGDKKKKTKQPKKEAERFKEKSKKKKTDKTKEKSRGQKKTVPKQGTAPVRDTVTNKDHVVALDAAVSEKTAEEHVQDILEKALAGKVRITRMDNAPENKGNGGEE